MQDPSKFYETPRALRVSGPWSSAVRDRSSHHYMNRKHMQWIHSSAQPGRAGFPAPHAITGSTYGTACYLDYSRRLRPTYHLLTALEGDRMLPSSPLHPLPSTWLLITNAEPLITQSHGQVLVAVVEACVRGFPNDETWCSLHSLTDKVKSLFCAL